MATRVVRALVMAAASMAVAAACCGSALAADRFVGTAGSDGGGTNDCTVPTSPCQTIGQAVSVAGSGDTIRIGPGTFDEHITVAVDLRFAGAGASGPNETLIDATGTSNPALSVGGGATLSDLALTTGDSGIGGALRVDGGVVDVSRVAVTAHGTTAGTDAIAIAGGTVSLSDSTALATNTDADVTQNPGHAVVFDGSGVELSGGHTTITRSTIGAVEGIALRVHGTADQTLVRDSVVESSGTEDLMPADAGSNADGWQAIEAAAGALTLTGDTVYDATLGSNAAGQPPADAITTEPAAGVSVAVSNSILRARSGGFGSDADAIQQPISVDHSSLTSTATSMGATVTAPNTAGDVAGDPQLADPDHGDFSLTAGSPLIGAGAAAATAPGETDRGGDARVTACSGGVSVTNIGALEAVHPQCPAALPQPDPGPATFAYVRRGFQSQTNAYAQLSLTAGLPSPLTPFEVDSAQVQSGVFVTGSASPFVYALEHDAVGQLLEQYRVSATGQLVVSRQLDPAANETLPAAAQSPDGADLYVATQLGDGATAVGKITHDRIGADGAMTVDGTPLTLATGTVATSLQVVADGRVFAGTANSDGSSSLRIYRPNADGTLTQIGSQALAGGGILAAPDGLEAVETFGGGPSFTAGHIVPFHVTADGAITAEPSVPSGSPARVNANNPTGLAFSPDSHELFVSNLSEGAAGGSELVFGSLISPFAIGADGSLTAQTPTPDPAQASAFPNILDNEAGLAMSPDGTHLYVPDGGTAPGAIDTYVVAAGGALTPATPPQLLTDSAQDELVLVSPPGATVTAPPAGTGAAPVVTVAPVVTLPPTVTPVLPSGITGRVTDAQGVPLAAEHVSACPLGHSGPENCHSANTNRDGTYVLKLPAASWQVQVTPSESKFAVAAAQVDVSGAARQNFTLIAPRPLEDGLEIDGHDSGVPTVAADEPVSASFPIKIPPTGDAGSARLISSFATFTENAQSADPTLIQTQAAAFVLTAHYGDDGKLDGISDPLMGQIDCGSTPAEAADCRKLATPWAGGGTSLTRGGLLATAAVSDECLDASHNPGTDIASQTYVPNEFGGIDIVTTYKDGTTGTFVLAQSQIQSLPGNHPFANSTIALANGVLNYGPGGIYNTFVGVTRNSVIASQNPSQASGYNASSTFQVVLQGLGQRYEGPIAVVYNVASSAANNGIFTPPNQPGSTVPSSVSAPVTQCTSDDTSAYKDPSGTIKTAHGIPIAGAKVTLTRADTARGALVTVPSRSIEMSPGNRRNPDRSNELGGYGWDVLPGYYQVRAERTGCTAKGTSKTALSKRLPVPPAQTGIDLVLRCPHLTRTRARMRLTLHSPKTKLDGAVLTAVVSGRRGRPQGIVSFRNGAKRLGGVPLNPKTGTATISCAAALRCRGAVTATYDGDAHYGPVMSRGRLR
jgi:hypothetical protein